MKRSLNLAKMNARVGVMSVIAFAILVWVLFFPVRGVSPFSSKVIVKGYYDRVDGLRRNAPVYYQGIEVGSVRSVEIVPGRKEAPIEVEVGVETRVVHLLPKDTVMEIVARGLLGDVFVDMVPGTPGLKPIETGDTLATKPYESMLASFGDISGDLKVAVRNISNMLAKAQDRESSIGRLLNEDTLYQELVKTVREFRMVAEKVKQIEDKLMDKSAKESFDSALASAKRVLKNADNLTEKANNLKWYISVGARKYDGLLSSGEANLHIVPNKDKFYEGGLEYWQSKAPNTGENELAGGYAGYNAFLGLRVLNSPIFFRGGLKRTFVGAGLDLRMQDLVKRLPLEISADLYKLSQPTAQLDVVGKLKVLSVFRLTGGVENAMNEPRYFGGLTLVYDDEDLTSILIKSKM